MLKEILGAALVAAVIAGAGPSAAAGPLCPCPDVDMGLTPSHDRLRPHVDGLEPGSQRLPVAVTHTEADGSTSTIYIDPRSFAPVVPGMPGCTTSP